MVKTMLAVLLLGAISAGAAQDQAQCAVDGAGAVDGLTEAAMFIWAASKRCGHGSAAECTVDIASAAQAATSMIATIVGAVADCGAIQTANAECAAAVTGLTSAAAGLAAASGGLVDACPKAVRRLGIDPLDQTTNLGLCIMDAKGTLSSIFRASKYLSVAGGCKKNGGCADTALNIIMALADMGSNLAESFNDCSSVKGAGNDNADCDASGLALVSALSQIALAGKGIKAGCNVGAARLYENTEMPTSSSSWTVALAALLPISAVLSFVLGRRTRSRQQQTPERDAEPLMVEELAM